jgi:hypothetical protein
LRRFVLYPAALRPAWVAALGNNNTSELMQPSLIAGQWLSGEQQRRGRLAESFPNSGEKFQEGAFIFPPD